MHTRILQETGDISSRISGQQGLQAIAAPADR
jgi:hypothetical protein